MVIEDDTCYVDLFSWRFILQIDIKSPLHRHYITVKQVSKIGKIANKGVS